VQISIEKQKKYEKQGNMTPPNVHKPSVTEAKDVKEDELTNEEFKMLILKLIYCCKEGTNKQMNE
jgi:hypothetical protein